MDPGLVRDALTVLAGVATGILSGMFGVGGAVISTPAIRALGTPAAIAVGTTLPAIIPGAISGTVRYRREGLLDRSVITWTAPAGIACAVLGALLTEIVPGDGHLLMLLTAGLLGFSAIRMARHEPPDEHPAESDAEVADERPGPQSAQSRVTGREVEPRSPWRFVAVGSVAGLLSGLLGVGGGIVMVPGFTQLGGMPLKRAIGTSLACVALFAVPGTITHALLGGIDWRFALLLAVGVVPGARIGAAFTIAADQRRMRLIVAGFLGLTAVLYGVGELLSLAT